jgi:hypothetical protein
MLDENTCVAMVYQVSFRKLLILFTYVKKIVCTQIMALEYYKPMKFHFRQNYYLGISKVHKTYTNSAKILESSE